MNIFRDKRMVRSLLLLSWPVLLLFFGIWLWASLELPQAGAPSTPRNKMTDPEPVGLKRLFDSTYAESFKVAVASNNPFSVLGPVEEAVGSHFFSPDLCGFFLL